METPVEVSLCVSAYRSTEPSATAVGWVPTGDSITWGSLRCGAALAQEANFEENSPKLRCWLCSSMSPNVAASQKQVVPPLPRTTS